MKLLASLTIFSVAFSSFAFADISEEDDFNLIDVSSVKLEEMKQMVEGTMPNGVLVFREGSILPLRFFLTGNLIALNTDQQDFGSVEVWQTFYARFVNKEIELSSDLENWKSFFEFITGAASIQLAMDENSSSPFILFGADANRIP